jgi:hypothetical protein
MTTPQLSVKEIRQLAEIERGMDSGEIPYVVYAGHRTPIVRDVLDHLGLQSGQTVSHILWVAILETMILNLRQKLERE